MPVPFLGMRSDPRAAARPRRWRGLAQLLGLWLLLASRAGAAPSDPARQREDDAAARPKSVVELQPFERTRTEEVTDGAERHGRVTLIDLNPNVHAWFLLRLDWKDGASATYHLENPDPLHRRVELDPEHPTGLTLASGTGSAQPCDLWVGAAPNALARAAASGAPYAPLCGEQLYLRRPSDGQRTAREWVADLLRDHVWAGERITEIVRDTFFRDAWLETSKLAFDGELDRSLRDAPDPPELAPDYQDASLGPGDLALPILRGADGKVRVGHWYPVRDEPGVFVSVVTPGAIAPGVLRGVQHPVNELDRVEQVALADLVAFDLDRFDLGYSIGTDHPRVDWSDRALASVRDAASPGPDGIRTIAPLVRTGTLSPADQRRVTAIFTAGFKRRHGAMHWGALAQVHRGSHYGFVEEGVILSKLQPGLATAVVFGDGRVDLRTWSEDDDRELARVRYARQNGVPLVERDSTTGRSEPGALVTQWGPGNWSGSEDESLRTLRAGLCLLERNERRFLVYGWFSSATPSAMATVFAGYGCRYAMLLDMNALEHTYLALYQREDAKFSIEHLVEGMSALDPKDGASYVPRFVGLPDNRDFFFLLRRGQP